MRTRDGAQQHGQVRVVRRGVGIEHAAQHLAQHARAALGALGVAADPEEIVGDAARHLLPAARQRQRPVGRAEQADLALGLGGEHPDVLADAAALVRHHAAVARRGDAGQAAGHDGVAVGSAARKARSTIARGSRRPSARVGAVDSATCSWAT